MTKRNRRGAPWLYLILALLAAIFLYLFGWPIVSRVILHRGNEAFEETAGPSKPNTGAPALPGDDLPDEP